MPQAHTDSTSTAAAEETFRGLIHTFGLVRRVMEPYYLRFGISVSQWAVMRTLHRARGEGRAGLRLTDLGDRLIVRPPSVTGVVDRLQRMGHVARAASPTDLRVKYVSLTPQGVQLVERVLEGFGTQVQSVLAGLGAGEQRNLRQLLDRLGGHLELLAGRDNNSNGKTNSHRSRGMQ
jgi:MarR family transcriptional regulator, 2-MHQ and catechol-resistance regulon repressor